MKTLGIVPARAGSKRLPKKNTLPLCGRPLIEWVLDAALEARAQGSLDHLVVSSDDPAVLALATARDPALPLRRPAELASDTAPALDYVRHALQRLEAAGAGPFDAVVILQPTSPLTLASDVAATLARLEESGAESAVSVVQLDHAIHPVKLKTLEGDRLLPWWEEERGRMAAHELPELYVRNCAVYATRRQVIEGGALLGADCRAHVMPRERSIDINDQVDLYLAERLLQARLDA